MDKIKCSICEGSGKVSDDPCKCGRSKFKECEKCKGHGKLDWIENIVGKKNPWPWISLYFTLPCECEIRAITRMSKNE